MQNIDTSSLMVLHTTTATHLCESPGQCNPQKRALTWRKTMNRKLKTSRCFPKQGTPSGTASCKPTASKQKTTKRRTNRH